MKTDYDLAILGGGFAGSLLAMIARRLGRTVILLERGKHPRFSIGESTTPLANLLLEELAKRYDLPEVAPLSKWVTLRRTHPELNCGLKRGFTFYHHALGEPWRARPDRGNELLVAASPSDAIADTHWDRADFDQFLFTQARALGAECVAEFELEKMEEEADANLLRGRREGQPATCRARFVFDASGSRGALHRALKLGETEFNGMPKTEAFFAHFRNVRPLADGLVENAGEAPYPVDDAAVHHVFDGGWIWVLRFGNGLTSAGAALTPQLARTLQLADGAVAWSRLLDRLPTVRGQFEQAVPVTKFFHLPRVPFRSASVVGKRWALLPSAFGAIDPMLSTGFPLALLGLERLAQMLERDWESPRWTTALSSYARSTEDDLLVTARLIGALYANFDRFQTFRELTLIYFAAASYTETARRLNRPELARGFLLREMEPFASATKELCSRARIGLSVSEHAAWSECVHRTIAPFDLAGLTDPARRFHFPVRADDLRANRSKIQATDSEIDALLARCGFTG